MSNSIYESIMTGLNEALEDAKNTKPILKRHKVTIEPVKVYEAEEAWEAGTNHPSGAASRLLSMIEQDKELIIKFPFLIFYPVI